MEPRDQLMLTLPDMMSRTYWKVTDQLQNNSSQHFTPTWWNV